jgi:DNA-binding Xre family transcriptional regulator
MKIMRVNLRKLMGEKAQREMRRITLRTVADETKLSRHTVYAMGDDTIKEYPKAALVKLCEYFACSPGELLELVDVPSPAPDSK